MRARLVIGTTLVALIALSVSGCGQIKQAITPKPKINHVTIAAKVAAPGAQITGTLTKNPPANLPLWPGSTVTVERSAKTPSGSSWSATFTSTDPYADIVNGTAKGFQDASWDVSQQDVSSGDTSATAFTVTSQDGQGVVTITAKPKQPTELGYFFTGSN